jgi:hypothetical protein
MKLFAVFLLVVGILAVIPLTPALHAQTPSACPNTCATGAKLWIDTSCQQKRLLSGPEAAGGCCLFYCAASPDPKRTLDSTNGGAIGSLGLDPFKSAIKLDTPAGIATLIATAFEMFLGAVALYLVYIAVKSAMLLSNAGDSSAMEQAKKNLTSAVIGLFIVGGALGLLQILINLLGLGSINDIFNVIAPFLSSGTK